jgi:hypothetical protein
VLVSVHSLVLSAFIKSSTLACDVTQWMLNHGGLRSCWCLPSDLELHLLGLLLAAARDFAMAFRHAKSFPVLVEARVKLCNSKVPSIGTVDKVLLAWDVVVMMLMKSLVQMPGIIVLMFEVMQSSSSDESSMWDASSPLSPLSLSSKSSLLGWEQN